MAREFSEKLHEMTDAFPGDMQLLFRTLTGEEEEVAIDPDRRVVSASTIKVPVLGCLLDTLGENGTPLEAMHPVTAADILDDTLVFDTGAREASWYEIAWWMIVNSDNTAANVLMKALTFSRINDWCQRRGLRSTRAERMMLDYDAIREGRNNYISPSDYASLVIRADRMTRGEEKGTEKERERAALMMRFLAGNRDYDALLRYIYEQPVCFHKSGDLDTVAHDAGIFEWNGQRWFLGVFTSGFDGTAMDYEKARGWIGRVSRAVFDYMKER